MVHEVHTHLREKGVNLVLGDGAASFEKVDTGLLVKTQSGKTLSADMVVLGIGVRPEIDLAKKAGLTIGKRGGIVVDETLRTSDPNIWAVRAAHVVFLPPFSFTELEVERLCLSGAQ